MKELSVQEKAKAYDEALKVLHKYDGANIMFTQDLKEEMFPELKESEDEKIRKALIEYFNEQCDMSDWNGVYGYQVVAWLEKQGEQKKVLLKELDDKLNNTFENETPESLEKFLNEHKPTDKIEPKFKVGDKIQYSEGCGTIMTIEKIEDGEYIFANNMGHTTIESGNKWYLVEHKPTDKVEPKFHKGDWVIFNGLTLYIKEVVKGFYRTISIGGISNSYDWDIDKIARPWTIQDAKDGDVLSYRDGQWIFIYKEIVTEENTFNYYALLSEKGITVNDEAFTFLSSCITPATKEQHDALMKAMADAGYTFDFENKELKKVEQNLAWNKEDERMFDYALDMIEWYSGKNEDKSKLVSNYLKSLKERIINGN